MLRKGDVKSSQVGAAHPYSIRDLVRDIVSDLIRLIKVSDSDTPLPFHGSPLKGRKKSSPPLREDFRWVFFEHLGHNTIREF